MLRNAGRGFWFGAKAARRLSTITTSTETSSVPRRFSAGSKEGSSLYRRLSALDATSENVNRILNEQNWRNRNWINKYDIVDLVDLFHGRKQFNHALQLLEWMEKRGIHLSYREHAKRINLLWKTSGIAAAEKYFTELPKPAKCKSTYGVLLNCYCCEKMTNQAEALLEKMRILNFASNTIVYNSLMSLHMGLGEPEKVPPLAQQMREKRIAMDACTHTLLMSSYASLKDIEGVERVVEEMKKVGGVKLEWTVYSHLASIYIAAGLFEKAESAIKELQRRMNTRDRIAYHFLLSLYASIGNAAEVYRIWESLKSAFPITTNISYLTMLQTLVRINDLDGLKKCFREWELAGPSYYDLRLVHVLLKAYLKQDMIEEAKTLLEHAVQKGSKPNFTNFVPFIDFYMKNNHMDLALKYMEIDNLDMKENERKMYLDRVHIFLNYFEEEKNVDGAAELYRILKQANFLDQEVYGSLQHTLIAAGRIEPPMS